jgi:hypothetical protein
MSMKRCSMEGEVCDAGRAVRQRAGGSDAAGHHAAGVAAAAPPDHEVGNADKVNAGA